MSMKKAGSKSSHFSSYNYEVNSFTPNLLRWELEYDKFTVHDSFKTYQALFNSYSHESDSRYTIPSVYTVSEASAKASDIVTGPYPETIDQLNGYNLVYVNGDVNINEDVSLADEYFVASGDIYIDVSGYIRNCVFISTGGSVYITCRNIENDSTDGKSSHKMIQAKK